MNIEPQKFFIGIVDFFAILMPGALLSFSLREWRLPFFGPDLSGDAAPWMMFVFASYLLGHFAYLVGSLLDALYDWRLRRWIAQRRKDQTPAHRSVVFSRRQIRALDSATAIRRSYFAEGGSFDAIGTYQWAKLRLIRESPETLVSAQRFEADSKFFRSLVIVLLLLLALDTIDHACAHAHLIAVLLGLALWRYAEQRQKATMQVYWSVITLESLNTQARGARA